MKKKILHIVGRMDRGGVETWLMHVMRHMDRMKFEFHFLVQTDSEAAFDAEVISLGGKIYRGGNPKNVFEYAAKFKEVLREHGPYDAVHSHVYWYSGFVAKLAYENGIPIRIAHSHNGRKKARGRIHRFIYESLMRSWIQRYATHQVAASIAAGDALFGEPYFLICYGLDFEPFAAPAPLMSIRQQLGIDPSCRVISHIGRFVPQKNHAFLIEIFERLAKIEPSVHLLMIGNGPTQPEIRAQVASKGLSSKCTFTGVESNVAPFLHTSDLFLFPSRWEGLGLVTLESQAAGVPVIASTKVPREIDVVPGLVQHMSLSAGPDAWARAAHYAMNNKPERRGDEVSLLQNSRFGINSCLDSLLKLYSGDQVETQEEACATAQEQIAAGSF